MLLTRARLPSKAIVQMDVSPSCEEAVAAEGELLRGVGDDLEALVFGCPLHCHRVSFQVSQSGTNFSPSAMLFFVVKWWAGPAWYSPAASGSDSLSGGSLLWKPGSIS